MTTTGLTNQARLFTKLIYGAALLLVGLSLVLHVRYALVLFEQMPTNPNIVNPVTATTIVLIAALVAPLVLIRLGGLVRGTVTLQSPASTGLTSLVRTAGIIFMTFGVLLVLGVFVSLLVTRISAIGLIASQFQTVLPVGLGLFELSRVMDFERAHCEA